MKQLTKPHLLSNQVLHVQYKKQLNKTRQKTSLTKTQFSNFNHSKTNMQIQNHHNHKHIHTKRLKLYKTTVKFNQDFEQTPQTIIKTKPHLVNVKSQHSKTRVLKKRIKSHRN